MTTAISDAEIAFLKKYPNADLSKFRFLSDNETFRTDHGLPPLITVWFIKSSNQLVDIASWEFKHNSNMQSYLHSDEKNTATTTGKTVTAGNFPKIFLTNGTIQKIPKGTGHFFTRFGERQGYYDSFPAKDILNYPIHNFRVYVNKNNYFLSKLPPIETFIEFPGKPFRWNSDNGYFRTVFSVYCASYCCGVSLQHLTPPDKTFPVITSIMKFHLYFTVRRLIRRMMLNESMSSINTEFSGNALYNKIHLLPWTFSYEPTEKNGIKGVKNVNVCKGDYKTHYKRYVPEKSNGLTTIGLQYLNQSIEAYVYAVLGSQAKTRVSIIKQGGGSLETQQEFRKLVSDAIVNYSVSTWILNMNKSISDTFVKQDLAICPEAWLVPSKMVILKNPIMGYNNLLKTATGGMSFGVNNDINYKHLNIPAITGNKEVKKELATSEPLLTEIPIRKNLSEKKDQPAEVKSELADKEVKYAFFTVSTLIVFLLSRYVL